MAPALSKMTSQILPVDPVDQFQQVAFGAGTPTRHVGIPA
jgi:hypothetical protein